MKSWPPPPPPPPSTTFFIYFSSISILFSGSTAARTLVANRKAEDYTHMILEADVLDACSWTSFGMFRSRLTWDDDSPNYCWYARYALKSPTSHIIILHHIVSVCFSGVFFLDSWVVHVPPFVNLGEVQEIRYSGYGAEMVDLAARTCLTVLTIEELCASTVPKEYWWSKEV